MSLLFEVVLVLEDGRTLQMTHSNFAGAMHTAHRESAGGRTCLVRNNSGLLLCVKDGRIQPPAQLEHLEQ